MKVGEASKIKCRFRKVVIIPSTKKLIQKCEESDKKHLLNLNAENIKV